MKRVLALVLALILCLGMFAGCGKEDEAPTTAPTEATTAKPQENNDNEVTADDLKDAIAYVKTIYKKVSETTPSDFKRIASVPIKKIQHPIVWTVNVAEDLVKVLPAENGQVTIDVNEKTPEEVPYELTATISNDKGESVSHTWKHILPAAASLEDMQEIVKAAYALEKGKSMGYAVTLQGVITMINTPWDDAYQNISVTFVVEGCDDMPIQAYRMKGDGCKDLKIGDTITVTGELKNYNGTIEFDAGCTLDAVIKGEEVKAPEDPKQIVDEAYALGANQSLKYEATLTGTIITVSTPYDSGYKNITVIMEIEGRESKPIQCYRLKGEGADKIGINDIITVKGYITNYVGSKGYSTIQFTAGCQLVSWEDRDTPEQPSDPKQVVDEAYALGANKSLKYEATLTGRITKVKTAYDPNFGNVSVEFVVEGRENKPILAYRMKGTGVDKLGIGDIITVKGFITNYVGDAGYSTIEYTAGCQLLSYKKNTAVAPTDSLQIVKEAYQLAPGKQLPYEATVTGKITKVNTAYDSGYKNVTVTIVVEGGEDMPIKCYRLKGTNADKIGVGDVITVKGYIENYVHASSGDSEVEFTAGCQLIKWVDNGTSEPSTPDVPVTPGSTVLKNGDKVVIFAPAYNKALSADKVDANSFYNKGVNVTVSGNTVTGYGNAEIWTVIANADGTYSFANGGKNIALGAEFSSMNLGEVNDDWKLISLGGKLFNVQNVGRGNFIEWYASKDNWSTYNSNRAATDDQFQLSFFVIGTGIVEDNATPEQPEEPDVPDVPTTSGALKDGDKVVIYAPAYNKALSADKVDANSFYNKGVDVTVSGNTVTGYSDAEIWTVIANADGTYSFANGGKNIALGAEFSSMNLGEIHDDWKVISLGGTLYNVQNVGRSNFIEWYASKNNWSSYNSSSAATDDQFQLSFFVIGAGILEEEEPDTPVVPDEPDVPDVPDVPTADIEMVTAPVAGTAYKLYLNQNTNGTVLFFNGTTESASVNYRLATTEDLAEAVDVCLEAVTGGYALYFMDGNTKTYIRIYERTDGDPGFGKGSLEFVTSAPAEVLTYDSTLNTLIYTADDGENAYYLGTYSNYTTFSVSNTHYITGENAGTVEVSQFPAHLGTITETEEPSGELEMVTAPAADTAYKLYMNQNTNGTVLFFNGTTESASVNYRLATTEDLAEAVDVYLEAVTGGYALYFMDGNTKTYIRIYERTDGDPGFGKGSLEFVTSAPAEVLTYDSTLNTLIYTADDGENAYYLGTYSNYTTFSVSNTHYITGENAGTVEVSQFPAHFGTVSGSTTPDPEPEEPTPDVPAPGTAELVTAPVAGTAYKLGMDFEGAIHYITGATGNKDYYLATTTDASQAVDVYLEEEAGCYYLYFMNGTTKTYIRVYEYLPEEHKGSLQLVTEKPVESFTFDAATNTLFSIDEDGEDTYYMGTYFSSSANKIYDTVSTSNISYITGENASKVGVSQFPVHLYTVQAGGGTVTPEPENPTPDVPAGTTAGLMTQLPVAGDVVIIYNSGMAMTATVSSGKLAGEAADASTGLLNVTATMAQLTVSKDGEHYVFICGGKYLTSAPTGNGLTFESTLSDLGKWTIEAAEGTNTWIIKNVGANYNGNYNQALETYNGNFTTYGVKATEIYQMQLYKVGGAAPEVTPPTGGGTTPEPDDDEPVTPPPADTTGDYRKIEKVADLTAGTYLIAAYATSGNKGAVDFTASPWHFWDGQITTGNNYDMVTNTYAYANGSLTKHSDAAVNASKNGDAVAIELVAVDGKANTYYIKLGDLYLSSNGAAKRKLQLTATPAEWVAEDNTNGGIVFHQHFGTEFVTIGFADAASNMIRCYKSSSGNMNSGIKAGLYFFAEN